MREERHLLGQMMNQVHQQQQELKELKINLRLKINQIANIKSHPNITRGYPRSTSISS